MSEKFEKDLYMRVIDKDAASAKAFIGTTRDPVDLGPADPKRYMAGLRVWGFTSRPETAEERALRIWSVAAGMEVPT